MCAKSKTSLYLIAPLPANYPPPNWRLCFHHPLTNREWVRSRVTKVPVHMYKNSIAQLASSQHHQWWLNQSRNAITRKRTANFSYSLESGRRTYKWFKFWWHSVYHLSMSGFLSHDFCTRWHRVDIPSQPGLLKSWIDKHSESILFSPRLGLGENKSIQLYRRKANPTS